MSNKHSRRIPESRRIGIMPAVDSFDQLADTDAARDALGALRRATGERDGAMERHCLRVRYIAEKLAEQRGWPLDAELLTVAALLHDIGLYPDVAHGGVYTAEGAALAQQMLPQHGWTSERVDRCAAAIDRHHDLRSQRALGPEVETLRLADLVELSGGLLRFGLDREWLGELNRAVPRSGLVGELVREVGRALRERPLTVPQIFWRS
jgi:putative nucleotidyltransferase with HDIG domain